MKNFRLFSLSFTLVFFAAFDAEAKKKNDSPQSDLNRQREQALKLHKKWQDSRNCGGQTGSCDEGSDALWNAYAREAKKYNMQLNRSKR